MFGMASKGKQIFSMGGRLYALVISDGPIGRNGERYAAQFDHEARVLRVSRLVPLRHRPWVVAVAVCDAWRVLLTADAVVNRASAAATSPAARRPPAALPSPESEGGRRRP